MLSASPHVVQISFFVDPQQREPEQLLRDWPTLVEVAEAAHGAGVRVSVVQACSLARSLMRNGVDYHFFAAEPTAATPARSTGVDTLIRSLDPDVLHVHGLGFFADVAVLAKLLPGVPILLQDHASRLPRPWRRRAWRRGLSLVSGVAFCATEQSTPFAKAGLFADHTRIYEIPESSSRFTPGDQALARQSTGLAGNPCLLWVGHLNANKDPLTVLDGVSEAAGTLPEIQLWCCFGTAPLHAAVTRRIARDPRLRCRVHLLGSRPHEQIEQFMRAADFLVSGSHREGSGYALIEALACGLPPVVTDIPSFRTLTGGGAVGRLWPCGEAQRLCASLLSIASQPRAALRAAVRTHFDCELSVQALGRQLADTYRQLHDHRPARAAAVSGAGTRC